MLLSNFSSALYQHDWAGPGPDKNVTSVDQSSDEDEAPSVDSIT